MHLDIHKAKLNLDVKGGKMEGKKKQQNRKIFLKAEISVT